MKHLEEVKEILTLYSDLLIVHRKDIELARMLRSAVSRMRDLDHLPQFHSRLQQIINEIRYTNGIAGMKQLMDATPPGILQILRIPGIGCKKVRTLWQQASIADPDSLQEAARNRTLSRLPGFGEKMESIILKSFTRKSDQ